MPNGDKTQSADSMWSFFNTHYKLTFILFFALAILIPISVTVCTRVLNVKIAFYWGAPFINVTPVCSCNNIKAIDSLLLYKHLPIQTRILKEVNNPALSDAQLAKLTKDSHDEDTKILMLLALKKEMQEGRDSDSIKIDIYEIEN